jgi:diguanylate cyclase (GGDEF)-like protein/PAS domain S-box-containing protein
LKTHKTRPSPRNKAPRQGHGRSGAEGPAHAFTSLDELERRFELTFNHAAIGMTQANLDGRLMQANQKLADMLGYTRAELRGVPVEALTHPDDIPETLAARPDLIEGRIESSTVEKRLMRKDGSVIWVRRTTSVARGSSGEPLHFISVVEDISERKRAEEEILRERALLRTIIDTVPDRLYVKGADGRYWLANKAWLQRRGIDGADISGKTVLDFFPRDRAEAMAAEDAAIVEAGAPLLGREQKAVVKAPDGEPGPTEWISMTKMPMRDSSGKVIGTVGISRDITQQVIAARRREMEHAVTRVLAEATSFESAMPRILQVVCEGLELTCGAYWQWDGPAELLRCVETWHVESPGVAEFVAASRDSVNEAPPWNGRAPGTRTGGVVRNVWLSGAPMWIPDVTRWPDFRRGPAAARAGLHCAFGFPVLAGEEPLGVMEFFSRDIKEPDEVLLQAVRAIGSQIGQFIQRVQAEQALRTSEERYRDVFEASPLPMWVWEEEALNILAVNQAAIDHYGYARDEFLRMSVRDIWAADDRAAYEESIRRRSAEQILQLQRRHRTKIGRILDVEVTARRFAQSGRMVWLTVVNDITERKRAEDQLKHLAHYDVLTNLPNRVLFYDLLQQVLAQAKRRHWLVGVMFVDLDRFKNVNDTRGHAVGDRLLQLVAERLTQSVRSGDAVGRLGGDEFGVILADLGRPGDAGLVAQKIIDALARPFHLDEHETYVSASIGITLFPSDAEEAGALIMNADAAMYRAKDQGRNNFQYFTREMNERALARVQMEAALRRGIERREFFLHYQPRADLQSRELCGFEALLRWKHPEKGVISPVEFVPVLEDAGLIARVGEWVLRAVCGQIREWQKVGLTVRPVAVNLSARQLVSRDFGPVVERILREEAVDPRLIELEITESSLMSNTEDAARTLEYLSNLGVSISIDDFGTGYSSLSYLKRFPLDALKIDRSFVRDLTTDNEDATITRAVISMARSLGLKAIAEGVETEGQLAFLIENGCDQIQGYYYSRPLPADECTAWLGKQQRLQVFRHVAAQAGSR